MHRLDRFHDNLLVGAQSLRILAQTVINEPNVIEGSPLLFRVADLLPDVQAFLVVAERCLILAQADVNEPNAIEGDPFPAAVTSLSIAGQSRLELGQSLRIAGLVV
jgi:hypothetical protein